MRPFSDLRLDLGESPRWDEIRRLIWVVDIPRGRVVAVDLDGNVNHDAHFSSEVSSICLASDSSLALLRRDGLFRYTPETRTLEAIADPPYEPETHMFNDCEVDPLGRLWVGVAAVDEAQGAGSLHLWTNTSGFERIRSSMTLPNGLGWEHSGAWQFTIDSLECEVEVKDELSGSSSSWKVPVEFGLADGAVVDSSGNIWIAYWGGSCIRRHSRTGAVVQHVAIPVDRVTAPLLIAIDDQRAVLIATTAVSDGLVDRSVRELEGRLFMGYVSASAVPANRLTWS